jgi:hypothetical protein
VIETVCPDEAEHRRRVETRTCDLEGFTLPSWEHVRRTAEDYEPRTDADRLVIDTRQPPHVCVERALAHLDELARSSHRPGAGR